jgi:hypothetical protein
MNYVTWKISNLKILKIMEALKAQKFLNHIKIMRSHHDATFKISPVQTYKRTANVLHENNVEEKIF